jgi:stage II sporulation protein AB (anti-sigma F factor)
MALPVAAVPYVSLKLETAAHNVGAGRRAVTAFAAEHGADGDMLELIAIAVTEALNNAVIHAYPDRDGTVEVAADVEDGDLEIVVCDDGDGFRPGVSPGMGLGLLLIERCADVFLVRNRIPSGVEVWMRFALAG